MSTDYFPAYEKMIVREGGYKLTNDPRDRGGMTYAGVARNMQPKWAGWAIIDQGGIPPSSMVRDWYRANFWTPLRLDAVDDQRVASTLFDFAVNAGVGTSAKLAQIVVGVTPDGQIGVKSIAAINAYSVELFLAHFTLAKIARYRDIVKRDKSQLVYLVGWLNRSLEQTA